MEQIFRFHGSITCEKKLVVLSLAVQHQCLLQQIVCRNHRVIYLRPFERRDCNLCLRIRRPTFSTTLVRRLEDLTTCRRMCVLVECNVELPWIACITIPNLVGQNGGTRCFALWEERRHHVVLQLANLGYVQTVCRRLAGRRNG